MSVWPSSSRTLAPAPSTSSHNLPESSPGSSGTSLANQVSAIKRASTACQSCKQIKRKCDETQPCSNCRKSQTTCVYDEAGDGRRRAARKRTVESLELKRDALDSILDALRTSDDRHIQTLIHLIQSHAPLQEIVEYAQAHAEHLPKKHVRKITTVAHGQSRKTVLSVDDLCDTPLVKVPARPWTSVTDDDELVSHLISVYFTWYHIAYPVVDKDLFLHDMRAGDLECEFCSPLLVNSMLTIACHFSDHPRVCQVPADPDSRGRHFLDQATKLWNEQEIRPTLLNIQATSILAVATTLVGKDRLSMSYIEQMNKMQQEYIFKTVQANIRGSQPPSPQLKLSQYFASWTAFLLNVGYGSAFMRPLTEAAPAKADVGRLWETESNMQWSPYPRRSPVVTFSFQALFEEQCRLHEIGFDIHRFCFGENKMASQQWAIQDLDQRLNSWKHNLPQPLLPDDELAIIKPPIMDLHLTFHWFRITLFNFVKDPGFVNSERAAVRGLSNTQARSEVIESAREIADLCRQYTRDFGLKQVTIWMPQTCLSAAHSLVDALSDESSGALVQEIFHELCLVLVAASQRWLVMRGHVRMLFVTAKEKGQRLPEKTKDLLKFVALDRWGEKDHLQFASASYPNYTLAKDEDPRLTAMGDLLEKWATIRVHVEEEKEEEAEEEGEEAEDVSESTTKDILEQF